MELNMYAVKAQQTAVFTRNDYPLVALGEEVGEVMGKIAKFGRKNDMSVEEVINARMGGRWKNPHWWTH